MYIKTKTFDKNTRHLTFNDVRVGEIFRCNGCYYIAIKPVITTIGVLNAIEIVDGGAKNFSRNEEVEIYLEKSIILSEDKFESEIEVK